MCIRLHNGTSVRKDCAVSTAVSPALLDTSSLASLVPALPTALAVAAAPGTAAVVAAKLEPLWSLLPGRWFSACAEATRVVHCKCTYEAQSLNQSGSMVCQLNKCR